MQLVFSHCDLLSANVILEPRKAPTDSVAEGGNDVVVDFIDYEYATPAPAAFDIANHFAEWGGYDCDYNMLPTRAVRRDFLQEYVASYEQYAKNQIDANGGRDIVVEKLFHDVDRYRGIPGFYWCVVLIPLFFSFSFFLANAALDSGVSGRRYKPRSRRLISTMLRIARRG